MLDTGLWILDQKDSLVNNPESGIQHRSVSSNMILKPSIRRFEAEFLHAFILVEILN